MQISALQLAELNLQLLALVLLDAVAAVLTMLEAADNVAGLLIPTHLRPASCLWQGLCDSRRDHTLANKSSCLKTL